MENNNNIEQNNQQLNTSQTQFQTINNIEQNNQQLNTSKQ